MLHTQKSKRIAPTLNSISITLAVIGFVLAVISLVLSFAHSSKKNNENEISCTEYLFYEHENKIETMTFAEETTESTNVSKNEPTTAKKTQTFRATAYCPCVECSGGYGYITATGAKATAGRTIAVDPSVIPFGTEVIINGHTYIAEDTGGAIKGNRIDIFFDNHAEASNFGLQTVEVVING